MKIPYNVLHVSGNVLFAARGGRIHSFSLDDGRHISTWKHPDVEKIAAAAASTASFEALPQETPSESTTQNAEAEAGSDEPPSKRQRVEEKPKDEDVDTPDKELEQEDRGKGKEKQKGKKARNRQNNEKRREPQMKVPDRPVVTHMTSTADGSRLVAVSGHDKVIWVFEHDGEGRFIQLSQRTMPKRPSSVAIGPDSQIICADKFGDVYALPLLTTASPSAEEIPQPSSSTPSSSLAVSVSKPTSKPAANATTVHSKRNLRALANQQQQMELATRSKAEPVPKTEGPAFELTLLLGHVSMLTSLVLGESEGGEGRRYILTADRDEHIRVSRYLPQAYVIEGFCFGHTEFVSSMVIPANRGHVLVSGGGDDDVFVWNWKASRLLSRKSVLSLVREILPDLAKVAVSSLKTLVYPTADGELTYIIAICEDIQAIFSWQLTEDNTLNHPSVIQLPGKPLDVEIVPGAVDKPPRVVAAVDAGEQQQQQTHVRSLAMYSLTMTDEKLAVDTTSFVADEGLEAEELDMAEKDVRALLYTVENLRKQPTEERGGGDGQTPDDGQTVEGQTAEGQTAQGHEVPDVEPMEE